MGCACGKQTATAKTYTVQFPDGSKRVYASKIEADAAAARSGGKVV